MASLSSKIDFIFIAEPSDSLKCRICFEICRDPRQCERCGKLFCKNCIEMNGKKPCPNCRSKNPRFFKDIRGARDIKELKVRCAGLKRGCEWTGTIATADNHVSTCQFALVPCPNKCEEDGQSTIMKKNLGIHLKTACPNRAHQCRYCGERGTYVSITEDHDKVCNKKLVSCPNMERGCPLSMEREKTKQHVRSVCDYTEVACTYESLGCGVRMLRKDMKKHEEDDSVHVRLALKTVCKHEDQHITLDGQAMVFKLTEYSNKKEKNEEFYSKSFYTHSQGYKMCINVDVNGYGSGAGTHLSIFIQLLQGHHDDLLHWPFKGTVTYELLNQLTDDKHHTLTSIFEASDDMQVGSSRGKHKFLPHSSLFHDPATNTQYVLDDTLYFRVSVTVANHKPWLVYTDKMNVDVTRAMKANNALKNGESFVFKLTGYKNRKETNVDFYSDSFYTGPGGYKMCVRVEPNGYGTGHGTHVSIFAKLLEGAYDASLSWPFMGTVTFRLLNQLADKNHHSMTVKYEENDFAQVNKSLGYQLFISHSALPYDPVKNTQYLKDDTLYFKVAVEVDNHKSWLTCTHHTCM